MPIFSLIRTSPVVHTDVNELKECVVFTREREKEKERKEKKKTVRRKKHKKKRGAFFICPTSLSKRRDVHLLVDFPCQNYDFIIIAFLLV